MANKYIIEILVQNGLKVTPQRIAILEVILTLENHPSADNITEYLKISHPNISLGTIYRTLETFSKRGIIHKVQSKSESMRYDAVNTKHHHLCSSESDRIEDFYDEDLNRIINEYLRKKKIPNFNVEDAKLQIIGKFTDNNI